MNQVVLGCFFFSRSGEKIINTVLKKNKEVAVKKQVGRDEELIINTGLQRNLGTHENRCSNLISGCWFQIRNPLSLITSSF